MEGEFCLNYVAEVVHIPLLLSFALFFCFFFLSNLVFQKEKTIKVETLDRDSQAIQWEDKQWE